MSLKANGLSKIKQIRSLSLAPLTVLLSSATSSQWVKRANTLLGVRFKTYGFAWKWDAPKFEGLSWFSIILSLFFPIERAINWGGDPSPIFFGDPLPLHSWGMVGLQCSCLFAATGACEEAASVAPQRGGTMVTITLAALILNLWTRRLVLKSIKVYQITKDDPVTWSNFCVQLLGSF